MSVISIDLGSKRVNCAARRWRFWHKLAAQLDALVAYPIKNAVSERELRRVDEDIRCCRELVSKNLQQEAEAKLVRMRPTRAIRTDNKAGP